MAAPDARLINMWNHCNEIMSGYSGHIDLVGDVFQVYLGTKMLGNVPNIEALYYFILGLDWGLNRGPIAQQEGL